LFYLPNQQRFDPLAAGSLFANQNYLAAGFPLPILPFTLPLGKNFVYAYANQANLTIEREIAGSWKFSLGAQRTRGLHLNRPQDINSTDPHLLAQNAFNAAASGLSVGNPLTVVVPSNSPAFSCSQTGPASSIFVMIPGVLAQGHRTAFPQATRGRSRLRNAQITRAASGFPFPSTAWTRSFPTATRGTTL
jgi:hypothetical protein